MTRLAIIIPTRNRADLAANAIRSTLSSGRQSFGVVVSDNSTCGEQSGQLERFVRKCADGRVRLKRPPTSLSMTEHWNWVLALTLEDTSFSHVVLLTDRMMFKEGRLDALLDKVEEHADEIVSYNHDRVLDQMEPAAVELTDWSGDTIRLSSARLLELSASCIFPAALPRLMNAVVPRAVLLSNRDRYGSFVGSLAPDYSFCYRTLAWVDSILYWDQAPIVHYALAQSTGESVARGVATAASIDFLAAISGTAFAMAPCPGVRTVRNAILHEYAVACGEARSTRFVPVDIAEYVSMLRMEIKTMENRELAMQSSAMLEEWFGAYGRASLMRQQHAKRGGVLRRMARAGGVGPMLLGIRRRLSRGKRSLAIEEMLPTFAEADLALRYARTHDGEQLSVSRLQFLF